ncbi:hypothetical protein D3C86_2177140 [compost metagenome]
MRGNARCSLLDLGDLRVGQNLDAALLQPLTRQAGNLGIFHWHDLRQQLDNGHFRAHRAIKRSKFNADGA